MAQAKVNNIQAKRRKRAYLFVLLVFICWAGYTWINQANDKDELLVKYEATMLEKQKVEAKKLELEKQVVLLNDPEYISQLATKEQGMVYEGQQQIFTETP